ncbi:MAG: ATP-binding protein [Candidatus Limnocylindrales bacterium]|jgi:two-component system phosphate regulon sensor histidine kinase PhoR
MDAVAVAFIILLAILLGWALSVAISRGRTIERLQETTGASGADDVERRVRMALEEAEDARWNAEQTSDDTGYLTELLAAGVVRLRDDLIVEFANGAAHVMLERKPGSMIGRSALEAFVDARIEAIARTAMELGSASGEVTVRSYRGATLTVRARRSPVSGVWLVLEDVSELRRLQRIRAEFIDNLSHELRTPLTTISLLAETASRDAESASPRLRDRISKIEVETGHLTQMVNELLDLSRIESGTARLMLDDVDLVRVARTTAERLRLFAERQGLRIALDLPDRVPPVRGDEDRLGQVLVNLLHNAVKFSPNGGEIVVGVRDDGGEVTVWVRDPGIGVPRADLARIFERFYKVDRARVRGRGGTGLGLSICRHVVESHGGRIWAESEEGSGSTFTFTVPVGSSRAAPGPSPSAGSANGIPTESSAPAGSDGAAASGAPTEDGAGGSGRTGGQVPGADVGL